MCIDAPESTTNSLSSGFNVDAGRHLFSEGEKNVALFFSVNLRTLWASFHTVSWHIVFGIVFLLDIDPQILERSGAQDFGLEFECDV